MITSVYVQLLALQLLPLSMISFLAVDGNQVVLGFFTLISSVVGVIGTVYVARMANRAETDRIIAAMKSSDDDRTQAASRLHTETVKAAEKVAEKKAETEAEPTKVEVANTPENPAIVDIVKKE